MRIPFPDEGASPVDSFPVRVGPQTTARELEIMWHQHAQRNRSRNFIREWSAKDPSVAEAVLTIMLALPHVTGVQWVLTSDFRASPSHKDGGAIDLAPRPPDWSRYAASKGFDPLLNGRGAVRDHMWKALRSVRPPATRAVSLFIEDDHVHLHLHPGQGLNVVSWPKRTHLNYRSYPGDERCRIDPSSFKPRY